MNTITIIITGISLSDIKYIRNIYFIVYRKNLLLQQTNSIQEQSI